MKLWGIFIILCACIFSQIGMRPLANPDEGRYASIGHDMVQTGDWMIPRLNGLIYFEKPPLGYWSIALGQKIFGKNLFGARFFNALFTILTGFSLYWFGRYFLSRTTGLWAAFMYITAGLPMGMSQMLTLDNALTFYLTTTLLLFASGFLVGNETQSRRLFLWAYVFMSLTVLTKGLIGIVIPGIIGLPWLIYTGYIKRFKRMQIGQGLLLFLLITVPWHVLVQQSHPCFAHFYFWHEHFERYLSDVHNRMKPWYFLWNAFLLGCLPWIFFLPRLLILNLKKADKHLRQILVFTLIWPLMIVVFFSRSHSQLIPYILPAIPGIMLFLAYGWSQMGRQRVYAEYILWSLMFITAAYVLPHIVEKKTLVPLPLYSLYGAQFLLGGGGLLALILCQTPIKSFYILCGTTLAAYMVLPLYLPYFQRLNTQHVCQVINKHNFGKKCDVYCYQEYCNDAPFYLNQVVGTINFIPEEHQLGYRTEGCKRYTHLSFFQERWQEEKPCYVLVKHQDTSKFESNMKNYSFYRLTADAFFTLYCNQP